MYLPFFGLGGKPQSTTEKKEQIFRSLNFYFAVTSRQELIVKCQSFVLSEFRFIHFRSTPTVYL